MAPAGVIHQDLGRRVHRVDPVDQSPNVPTGLRVFLHIVLPAARAVAVHAHPIIELVPRLEIGEGRFFVGGLADADGIPVRIIGRFGGRGVWSSADGF